LPCENLVHHPIGRPFAICDPAHAPCGQYAEQALKHLGLWERVSVNMIRGTSAQLTLNWIALGEAGAGVVYASDVLSSEKVRTVVVLPEDSHAPIQYRIARLSDTEAARQAEAALMSDAAAEVFTRFCFILPSPAGAPE
ncbi:MAG: molybdate ABC transporter substrate-binding protein, partial [Alphaproteobacteria bacterium]|nr:molybdate ABC transporter substrate-binding protein [Alphaproteobacteria bacterium]